MAIQWRVWVIVSEKYSLWGSQWPIENSLNTRKVGYNDIYLGVLKFEIGTDVVCYVILLWTCMLRSVLPLYTEK